MQIAQNLLLNETDMEMSGPVFYYLASLMVPRKQRRTKPGQLI